MIEFVGAPEVLSITTSKRRGIRLTIVVEDHCGVYRVMVRTPDGRKQTVAKFGCIHEASGKASEMFESWEALPETT